MRTIKRHITLLIPLLLLSTFGAKADWELQGPLSPNPLFGTFYPLTYGSTRPPTPCLPTLFLDSRVWAIVGYPGHYVYDDTDNPSHMPLTTENSEGALYSDDSGDGPVPPPSDDFGTNLWLVITNFADGIVPLGILNTTNGLPYEILSSTNILTPLSNWVSEGIWIGIASNTPAVAEVGDRKNQLFFRARQWDGVFTYGVPTNGQLFLQVQSSPIYPVINGVTNTLSTFYSNWVMINPSSNPLMLSPSSNILTLNLGYDANDGGITNAWITTNASQGVLRLAGRSKSLTNLCISYNPITNLNVSSWPALQSVDAWHCTNNISVNVTNCPQLARTCFEAILRDMTHGILGPLDYTGCPNIAEVRAADNRFTDVLFTSGAGSKVWHLCIHDNTVNSLPANMDFTRFPSLKELWIWDNTFSGNLILTPASCTNLTSVQAERTSFGSIDVHSQTNLTELLAYESSNLTNLDVSGCLNLALVQVQTSSLLRGAVDSTLVSLDQGGRPYGTVLISGNAAPSNVGLSAADHLQAKGWTIATAPQNPSISAVSVTSGSNSATITWTTDVPSDSVVYYGTTTSYGSSATGNSGTTAHTVALTSLTPNTTYHFYVTSTSGSTTGYSGDNQFFTSMPPDPIMFVSTSSDVSMHVSTNQSATVTWVWNGATNSSDFHSFGSAATRTNYVIVNPPSALIEFGILCGNSTTALSSVSGLTNYPNLQDLFFYQSGLSNISLAGCSNLVHIALAACNPTSATEDQWFIDLAAAQATLPSGTSAYCDAFQDYFFYPSSPGPTSTSASARSYLTSIGWHLSGL